jgi:Ca2+-binding RTX toxin-like protein
VVTFAEGQTSGLLSVDVAGDRLAEADETFSIMLSNPVGAELTAGQSSRTATIVNDDWIGGPGADNLSGTAAADFLDGGSGPDVLTGVIRNEQGETIDTIEAPRRGTGLDVPYWSITTTIPERGLYEFALDGATGDPTPFLIFDAAEVSIPAVGTKLPPFDTPTTDDARGVDPVCTRLDGPCPFHDVTLTEALAAGKPVVYIIGTPAHCATATCGPGLDFLMAAAEQYGDVATFVHAEVYADPEATEVAPAVTAYTLDYEPVVWITDAEGTVVRRIDIVWDADELGEMLAASLG